MKYFTTKSLGFTKTVKVKIRVFFNTAPLAHAARIFDVSLEIVLRSPK